MFIVYDLDRLEFKFCLFSKALRSVLSYICHLFTIEAFSMCFLKCVIYSFIEAFSMCHSCAIYSPSRPFHCVVSSAYYSFIEAFSMCCFRCLLFVHRGLFDLLFRMTFIHHRGLFNVLFVPCRQGLFVCTPCSRQGLFWCAFCS